MTIAEFLKPKPGNNNNDKNNNNVQYTGSKLVDYSCVARTAPVKRTVLFDRAVFEELFVKHVGKYQNDCVVCLAFGEYEEQSWHALQDCPRVKKRCIRCLGEWDQCHDSVTGKHLCRFQNPKISGVCYRCYLPVEPVAGVNFHVGGYQYLHQCRLPEFLKLFAAAVALKEGRLFPMTELYETDENGLVRLYTTFVSKAEEWNSDRESFFRQR